jgi:O-antigen/teichoic acid export membrane protein
MSLLRSISTRLSGAGLKKGSWGLADQVMISGTNFVTMVLLARGLGPAGFGAFSLVYGAMLFANSIQGALIVQPHCVLSVGRGGQAYADYTLTTAITQLLMVVLAALIALGAGMGSLLAGWSETASLLLALSPCVVAWQLQEFVRRVLYNERRFEAAFANDAISYGGQTLAIGALWWTQTLTGPLALHAISVTSALASLLGAWQLRHSLAGRLQSAYVTENWHFGKWLMGAEMGNWLSSQMYFYLAGGMLGTAATGTMKAANVVFGPTRIMGFFLKAVLPNRFARALAKDGNAAMAEQVKLVYWMIAPFMASYSLLVAAFAGPVLKLLYGASYTGETSVLMLYAVFAFIAFMAQIVACALRAKRLTKRIFASQAYASLVAIPVGWILIKVWNVDGAVIGMILTSVVVNFSNWLAYRRSLATEVSVMPINAQVSGG